jgi:hypothetical protein
MLAIELKLSFDTTEAAAEYMRQLTSVDLRSQSSRVAVIEAEHTSGTNVVSVVLNKATSAAEAIEWFLDVTIRILEIIQESAVRVKVDGKQVCCCPLKTGHRFPV